MQKKVRLGLAKDYKSFDSSHIPIWYPSHSDKDEIKKKNKKDIMRIDPICYPPLKKVTPEMTAIFLKSAAIKMGKKDMYLYLLRVNCPAKFRFLRFFGRGDFAYGYRCWLAYEKKTLEDRNYYCKYIDTHKLRGPLNAGSIKISQNKMRFTAIKSFNKLRRKVKKYARINNLPTP